MFAYSFPYLPHRCTVPNENVGPRMWVRQASVCFHRCANEKKGSNLDLQRELHGGFERLKEPIVSATPCTGHELCPQPPGPSYIGGCQWKGGWFLRLITTGGRAAQRRHLPNCTRVAHFHMREATHTENQVCVFADHTPSLLPLTVLCTVVKNFFNKNKIGLGYMF